MQIKSIKFPDIQPILEMIVGMIVMDNKDSVVGVDLKDGVAGKTIMVMVVMDHLGVIIIMLVY